MLRPGVLCKTPIASKAYCHASLAWHMAWETPETTGASGDAKNSRCNRRTDSSARDSSTRKLMLCSEVP
jgi:hypothetical protein